jgi:hypothetical protein
MVSRNPIGPGSGSPVALAQRAAVGGERRQPAVAQHDGPCQHRLDDFEVMGRHDHDAACPPQLVEAADERLRGPIVEPRERLVEEHQPRIVQERAFERQPLAHPARETGNLVVATRRQLGAIERTIDARAGVAKAVQTRVEQEVLGGGQLGVEEEVVSHHPDALTQGRAGPDIVVTVLHAAGRRRQERRRDREERGLAGAVRAKQPDDLAGLAAQRDAAERPAPAVAARHIGEAERSEVHARAVTQPGDPDPRTPAREP